MLKNIIETEFSIIYKKDGNFIVVHECEEIIHSKHNGKICNSFLIYSFCNKKGKIIKQYFNKNQQNKFQLENIEKATKIPWKYFLWVKMNLRIPCFKYEIKKGCNAVDIRYVHSLGFSLDFDSSYLVNIEILKEFYNTKCANIIHNHRLEYNPYIKDCKISINKSSTKVESIIFSDDSHNNNVKVMFLEHFYKDHKIKSKLILIKNRSFEEKYSGNLIRYSLLEILIDVELGLKHTSYYKIKDMNKTLDCVYIDNGILHVRIKKYPKDYEQMYEKYLNSKNPPMSNLLFDLIDDIKQKDLTNSFIKTNNS